MQICECSSAELFREAVLFFLDDISTHISDLGSNAKMSCVHIVYYHACLSYIQKYKRAISVEENGPIRITKKKISERYINFVRDVIKVVVEYI